MNYIIFDLEFNQYFKEIKEEKEKKISQCPFEIIQIGAVRLDENFQIISTFNRLVKPELYKNIHPYVKRITGITMEELETSGSFKEIYKEFVDFVKGEENIFGVWGVGDMKELFRNIQYHQLKETLIPKKYINIQKYASKHLNSPKGSNVGLRNAVEVLEIPIETSFHDAFHDAYYTAEILKKIYSKAMEVNIYNPYKNRDSKKNNDKKNKVDTNKLINQFEKMYNREMSQEEKEIIKLAYIMGKTNQFQICDEAKE